MDWGHIVSLTTLVAALVATTFTELKDGRIPDWITLPALLVGFLVGYLEGGIPLGSSLMGFVAGFGFLFIFYMFGGMGGGDVKLMGAVGALMGFPQILPILMYTAFIGGAMALLVLVWNRRFWRGLGRSLSLFFRWGKGPSLHEEDEPEAGKRLTIPYGLAIVAGCLVHVFMQTGRMPR